MLSISVTNVSGADIIISAPGHEDIRLPEGNSILIGPISETSPEQSDLVTPEISVRLAEPAAEESNEIQPMKIEPEKTIDE